MIAPTSAASASTTSMIGLASIAVFSAHCAIAADFSAMVLATRATFSATQAAAVRTAVNADAAIDFVKDHAARPAVFIARPTDSPRRPGRHRSLPQSPTPCRPTGRSPPPPYPQYSPPTSRRPTRTCLQGASSRTRTTPGTDLPRDLADRLADAADRRHERLQSTADELEHRPGRTTPIATASASVAALCWVKNPIAAVTIGINFVRAGSADCRNRPSTASRAD